ncbi:MAG TPA: hypothetical protein VLA33_02395 [Gemmatimonadota bacterium]|nr:hypothetical protein [Gemmatimonadota bacterium]
MKPAFGAWPLVLLALLIIAGTVQFSLPINFDVSWYLYGAGRLLDGARLYVDWIEPNPPLIVWMSLPFQLLASWTGLSAGDALRLGTLAMVAGSIAVAAGCLRSGTMGYDGGRDGILVVWAFALLALVDHHHFQREHVFLALTLPYLCAAAVRAAGREISFRLAMSAGALAGLGLALKPYYLFVWFAVELALVHARTRRVLLRPENAGIAAVGTIYLAAVLVLTPEYFRIARLGAVAYRSYADPVTAADILLDPRAIAAYALAAFAVASRRRYPISGFRLTLLASLGGYLAAVVAQGKSFPNHWYPAEAMLALSGYATLADVWRTARPAGRRSLRLAMVGGITLVAIAILNGSATVRRWQAAYQTDPFYLDAMRSVLESPRAASFFTIGGTMRSSFPLAVVTGVPYESRFHSLWFLGGTYAGVCLERCRPFPYHDLADMTEAEQYEFDALIDDLARTRPEVLFVDRLPPQGLGGFEYLEYFSRDPTFRSVFEEYEFETVVGGRYLAYRRRK